MGSDLRLEGLGVTFPGSDHPAVTDLTLELPADAITVLVGPSGCGKTTTLKMINRLVEPSRGTVLLDGVDTRSLPPHELRRGIGYVIQQSGLFPHRTIAENIATVPRLLGWKRQRIQERVEELAELVGLDPVLADRYPAELSGGQQQRVGVARALAADPPVLLMDEPYSAVDPIVRARLQDELVALQARLRTTIVLVTHDIDEAIKVGDRIAVLNLGGILEQVDTPAELLRAPANGFVEAFLGAERGLKRLALLTVADVEVGPGFVVPPAATPDQAGAVMDAHGLDWIGVLDGERLAGWAWRRDLVGLARVGDAHLERFRAWVQPTTSLREALDLLVTSRTNVAPVFDGEDRYLGMLTVAEISEGVT